MTPESYPKRNDLRNEISKNFLDDTVWIAYPIAANIASKTL